MDLPDTSFKTNYLIICICCLFYFCKPVDKDPVDKIFYTISMSAENPELVHIKAELTLRDSVFYMDEGATQLPKGWATFVHNLDVIDMQGNAIQVENLNGAKWKIHAAVNQRIILTYDVYLEHDSYSWNGGIDGVAYNTELGIFYTGRTLFIMNGEHSKQLKVRFDLPTGWIATTPWTKNDKKDRIFDVYNFSDLTNSMIFMGIHKEISLKREDFELIFALGTEDIIDQETEFKILAEKVLDYYIELMGGVPNPGPDNPLKKSVVVISSSTITDGEALGNNISILIEKNADPFSKKLSKFIFAHEFFHLWNGKSFRPSNDDTEWFKEGFSNYYTLKALNQIGFLDEESYLDILNTLFYQRYKNDEGFGLLSLTNGDAKHDHWGLIYAGGMFAGISQDIIIRNATGNKKSIDDLMKYLYYKYGGTDERYSLEELRILMTELSGLDQTEFFNSYITGKEKIPIDLYLSKAGFISEIKDGNLIISVNEHLPLEQQKIVEGVFGGN